MKRVVVTGIGLISSIGNNLESTWNNLISGTSGIKKITNFDTEDLSCKIAGFISHDDSDKFYLNRNEYLDKRDINRNDRFIQYGLIAAEMAINDSNLKEVSEQISELKEIGVHNLMMKMNTGEMDNKKVMRSIELFAKHVIPNFEGIT